MASKKKMKNITFFTSFITLFSFLYKVGLGIYSMSLVLIIASISTLMVFICKMAFVKAVTKTRSKKKKAYLFMSIASFIYALVFLLFVVLKVNNIDISSQKEYTGWLGILLISFMTIMFVLSLINLKGSLEKTDIMVIGLKEITFISALADLVIIENYVYGIYINYKEPLESLKIVNQYFSLGVASIMLIVTVFMFIRYAKYKIDN